MNPRSPTVPDAATIAPTSVQTLGSLSTQQRAAWTALARDERCSYFSTPLWCEAWADAFAAGSEQRVAVWEEQGELVAVAPMVRMRETVLPSTTSPNVRLAVWQVIGAGLGGADHVGFACRPHLRESLLRWVCSLDGTLRLHNLTQDWASALPRAGNVGRVATATYQVRLRADEDHPGSKQLRTQLGRRRRRLVEQGVTFSVRTGGEIDAPLLEGLIALHQARSAVMGRRSSFSLDRRDFHLALARNSNEVQRSVMVCATIGDQLVGALYGFLDYRTFAYYQSGWSPRFQKWSLGAVVMAESIATARRLDADVFDLLRGDEPYKLRFGAELVEDVSITRYRGAGGAILRARDVVSARHQQRRADPSGVDPAAP